MDLSSLLPIVVAAFASGGTIGVIGVQWLKSRTELEKHWTSTTIELVDALHEELRGAKDELAALRPMAVRLAHLEEALDHIHALLASSTDAECIAAERRAKAFLKRMRGDERSGQRRQEVQADVSAETMVETVKKHPIE